MPEYAGFNVSLTSQYDAATLPEDHVRVLTTPALRSLHLDRLACESPGLSQQHPDKTFSDLHLQTTSSTIVETCIPIFHSSQFWICYECPPPGHDDEVNVKYYYFKFFASGKCILSWGVGQQDGWGGKTMFALLDGGRDFEGKRIVEKRGFFFPGADGHHSDSFEIRIFRAKARRTEQARYQGPGAVATVNGALDLTNIGKVQRSERQRHYSYALLDATDEPFVTFRYWIKNDEHDAAPLDSTFLSNGLEDTNASISLELPDTGESQAEDTEFSVWPELQQNTPPQQQPSMIHADNTATARRLSFPPRTALFSTTSRAEPSSPIKQQASASDNDLSRSCVQNHQYSSIAMTEGITMRRTTGLRKPEWTAVRAASPADLAGTRAGGGSHRKSASGSGGLFKSVVASALRRREDKNR